MIDISLEPNFASFQVNESDFSENTTPVNSPFLPPTPQQPPAQGPAQPRRPLLVKQKRSFHAPGKLGWHDFIIIINIIIIILLKLATGLVDLLCIGFQFSTLT